MAEKFIGRFVSDKSENYEEYLKELGFGIIVRKIAANMTINLVLKKEGNKWIFGQESSFKNHSSEFELDKKFEETTIDGRKFMTTVTLTADNKLVAKQRKTKAEGKESKFTQHLEDNGDTLVVIMQCGKVTARRKYKRQK